MQLEVSVLRFHKCCSARSVFGRFCWLHIRFYIFDYRLLHQDAACHLRLCWFSCFRIVFQLLLLVGVLLSTSICLPLNCSQILDQLHNAFHRFWILLRDLAVDKSSSNASIFVLLTVSSLYITWYSLKLPEIFYSQLLTSFLWKLSQ